LKQTIARFDEELATILIKTSISTKGRSQLVHRCELTTTSQTTGIHRTAFDNLHLSLARHAASFFDRTLAMKSDSVGHHAATQALVLSVAGVTTIVLIASLILLILY
jgi:hypothetical protein